MRRRLAAIAVVAAAAASMRCTLSSSLDDLSGGAADASTGANDAASAVDGGSTSSPDAGDAGTISPNTRAVHFVQMQAADYAVKDKFSAQLPNAVTAGNLVVAMVISNNPNSTATFDVSDSLQNTWKSTPHYRCTNSNVGVSLWYVEASKPGIDAVTATQKPGPDGGTSGYELAMGLYEYEGASILDVADGRCTSIATTAMSSPSVTTTDTDLLIGAFADPCGQGTMTPAMGWTARDVQPAYFTMIEDNLGVAPGAQQATGTNPKNSNCWVAVIAAFKLK